MTFPTDLQHEISERVEQPGFDEVLSRASAGRRRRRTTIASGLAVAVVVAAVVAVPALLPSGDDRSAPEPASPGLTDDRLPADVRELLSDESATLQAVVGSGDAAVAVWQACPVDAETCRIVLVTREGRQVGARVTDDRDWTMPLAVPGGWLVTDGDGWARLTPTGETEPVHDTGPGSSDVMAGDTAVPTPYGVRLLRGDTLMPVPTPPGSETYAGYVAPEGRLISVTGTPAGELTTIASLRGGGPWEEVPAPLGPRAPRVAMVAGSGDHVAIAFLGDDPDGSLQVLEVLVTHDAGRSWASVRGLDAQGPSRLRNASSLAVAPSGTAYLTTESHGLVRLDAAGNAMPTRLSAHDTSAFVLDDAVCVVAEAGRIDELQCSADDGATWAAQPLPGFG